MNKLLAGLVLVGAMLATPVFAQEDECFTKDEVLAIFANMEPTVVFEDVDTFVLKSPAAASLLEVEFDEKGCAVSQFEMSEVAFNLKYGEGV